MWAALPLPAGFYESGAHADKMSAPSLHQGQGATLRSSYGHPVKSQYYNLNNLNLQIGNKSW